MRLLTALCSGLLLIMSFVAPNVVLASDLVVIAAEKAGAELAPGKTLRAGTSISLTAGGRITVLAQSGEVIKLTGPYSGPVKAKTAGQGPSRIAAVSKLLGTSRRSATLGATRAANVGSGARRAPSNVWIVEADRAGRACVRADGMILWRPTAAKPATVALWPLTGAPKKIDWTAGASTQRITDQPLADGTQLSVLSGGRNTTLVLAVLPKDIAPTPSGQLLQWMASSGCRGQVKKLVRLLHGDG